MTDLDSRVTVLESQMAAIGVAATGTTPPEPPDPEPPDPEPPRTVLATVGFEDGTFSEWGNGHPQDSTQSDGGCGTDSWATVIDVDPSWGFPGTKAAQLYVGAGSVREDNKGKTTVRAQINADAAFTAAEFGEGYWYEWFLRLPSDPALNNGDWTGWHTLYQHGAYTPGINLQDYGDGAGPVFVFTTYKGATGSPHADVTARYPMTDLDRTYRMRVFLGWANDASGEVEWWVDGDEVIPRQASQTTHSDYDHGPVMNLDMYRDAKPTKPQYNTTVIQSGVERYLLA